MGFPHCIAHVSVALILSCNWVLLPLHVSCYCPRRPRIVVIGRCHHHRHGMLFCSNSPYREALKAVCTTMMMHISIHSNCTEQNNMCQSYHSQFKRNSGQVLRWEFRGKLFTYQSHGRTWLFCSPKHSIRINVQEMFRVKFNGIHKRSLL